MSISAARRRLTRHLRWPLVAATVLVFAPGRSASAGDPPPPRSGTEPPIWTNVPTRIDRDRETRERIEPPPGPPVEPRLVIRGDARVVDATTIAVDGRRLRLFGLVPVERGRICDVDGRFRWACGIHARAALGALTKDRTLRCRILAVDPDADTVVDCLSQDRSISERLVEGGWAELDTDGRATPALAAARARAERDGRGIWSKTGAPSEDR